MVRSTFVPHVIGFSTLCPEDEKIAPDFGPRPSLFPLLSSSSQFCLGLLVTTLYFCIFLVPFCPPLFFLKMVSPLSVFMGIMDAPITVLILLLPVHDFFGRVVLSLSLPDVYCSYTICCFTFNGQVLLGSVDFSLSFSAFFLRFALTGECWLMAVYDRYAGVRWLFFSSRCLFPAVMH